MNITQYVTQLETLLASSPFVRSYALTIDSKTRTRAFISGTIEFRDGSTLDFKEFVEQRGIRIQKGKYGYNYRQGENVLFRYDNAPDPRARFLASFPDHKHASDGSILESRVMTLSEVLQEIIDCL